jgi:UDP-glucose 4-epimerase
MSQRILVTGSMGLVGRALQEALVARGDACVAFDSRAPDGGGHGDLCDQSALRAAAAGCTGIVHLAAVSRVILGERDPAACWRTNVDGTRHVLHAALAARSRPWVVLASSREVYGEAQRFPVAEDAPLQPVNAYGRSKVQVERLGAEARVAGVNVAAVRLSNVYGCVYDHPDRVVPAFARAATQGAPLRVEGATHTFDFTHIDDTVAGFLTLMQALDAGEHALPTLHFVTGRATTLRQLASWAVELAGSESQVYEAPPRTYDVARFCGCPRRASAVLGWEARVPVRLGLARLIDDYRRGGAGATLAAKVTGQA